MKNRDVARLLRRKPTEAERRLWEALRRKQVDGLRFRRQHDFGRFIADFYCVEVRLAVEVDGGVHDSDEQRERDRDRDAGLATLGVRVLRVRNEDVERNLMGVLERIRVAARGTATPSPGPSPAGTGEGCTG